MHFVHAGIESDISTQTQKHTKGKNSVLKSKYHAQVRHDYPYAKRPKVVKKTMGKLTKKDPKSGYLRIK